MESYDDLITTAFCGEKPKCDQTLSQKAALERVLKEINNGAKACAPERARCEASEANLKANAQAKDSIASLRINDDDAAFLGIRKYRRSSVDALKEKENEVEKEALVADDDDEAEDDEPNAGGGVST
ncbi:hypothetical protein COCSUDRAFT_63676 [Coccomyxa subellipsoidea C-169]|uniref:Uncharacterized protein n=1 Tax=Coccomyxa subellipsoidea (strain C-169) TaxID=574566 RepID=I0YVV5_COCSC|nr:hypothetical protein COCSUDRAFT_63676 [Coccomyxa subellipsoidea C-169]EIE22524.1 hypothetical protein COCSUDRAFT_63676 [Coccomyxa subellipsoidea C-169]|eukprot:XP_005647068.1 hypothetical protein COCSUDRAFT_63676 [Coccomyxa subellipsoidea C-169]